MGVSSKRLKILTAVALLLPFLYALATLIAQTLILWYDPARDLLSAWNNLSKPTLLGPPSGIPGIFYGPYWIWLLSFGLFFSKNPLVVTFIAITLPYFILFPLIWFQFNKYFDRISLIICWLLFIFGNGITYTTQLWNPYPATLFTIAVIYLLASIDFANKTNKQLLFTGLCGFFIGLIINFHIAFGIALLCGTGFYFITNFVFSGIKMGTDKSRKLLLNELLFLCFFILGLFVAFIPTMLFEIKHGFYETQTLLHTFIKYGAVVTIHGLSKSDIFLSFFSTLGQLLHVPTYAALIILCAMVILLIYFKNKKQIVFSEKDKKILLLMFSLFFGVLFIYFTAKNPIWPYHFIGVDILFLPLIAFVLTKVRIIKIISIWWVVVVIIFTFYSFFQSLQTGTTRFTQQQQTVRLIANDAKSSDYVTYAYSTSIYTYDYSYLFRWLENKDMPYDPGMIKASGNLVYLIIPTNTDSKIKDFIHFRAPSKMYKETKVWKTEGGITIIKNVKK